jgi:hypothetical protein
MESPSVDKLMRMGTDLYGKPLFDDLYDRYLVLKPRMSDPVGCLAVLANPDRLLLKGVKWNHHKHRADAWQLPQLLDEYAARVGRNNVTVEPADIEFQIREALGIHRYGYSGSVDYPGMRGRRVYTGQPELGTKPDFEPLS